MGDATTLLFGLDGFRIVSVAQREEHGEGGREVVVEGVEGEQACRTAGCCQERSMLVGCGGSRTCRRSAAAVEIGAGQRLIRRLREQLEHAVSASTRSGDRG